MKRDAIVVTGGAGMLGSNFCEWLLVNKPEYDIIVVDNLFGGYLENVPEKCHFYLRDAGSEMNDIFEKYNIEYVFSFHSFSAEGLSSFVRKFNYTNNLVSLANIVNHCIKYKTKLIFASSMSVYGNGNPPFKETDYLEPIDSYGIGKMACERDIQVAGLQHGLKWAIIRPHNIIGPRQNIWDRYRNVVGIFMRKTLNGEPLTIYGDGEQKRAFSWVFDYCEPFWKVAENDYDWPVFNCGGDQYYTLNELADMVVEVTGIDTGRVHLQERFEVKTAYCDHSKVKKVLGFEDKTNLKQMLTEMWEWAKVQPNRPVKNFDNIELTEGLYDFWK